MKAMSLLDGAEKSGHNYLLSTESIFANENSPVPLTTSGKFVYKWQLSKIIYITLTIALKLWEACNGPWYKLEMKS